MSIVSRVVKFLETNSHVDAVVADFHKIVERLEQAAESHLTLRDNAATSITELKKAVSFHEAERLKAEAIKAKIKDLLS